MKKKISIFTTFILGLLFVVFQFRGFSKLIERGIHPAKNYLLVTDGRYGDYFEIKYKGDFIEVNGNDYKVKGRNMTVKEYKELQNFTKQFIELRTLNLIVKQEQLYVQKLSKL